MFRALAKIVVRSFEMQEWELDLLNPSLWNTNKSPCSVFCFNKFITGSLLRPFWLSCVWTKKYANSFFFYNKNDTLYWEKLDLKFKRYRPRCVLDLEKNLNMKILLQSIDPHMSWTFT